MSSPIAFPPPGFDDLSIDEQLKYVEALLEYAASRQEALRIPECHWGVLRERLANFREELEGATSWEEFEKELEQELTQT